MVLKKNNFRIFDDSILDFNPDLKGVLKPNDQYPELVRLIKKRFSELPMGSSNIKIIINNGEIVERVFKTPMGHVVSLFPNRSNTIYDQIAL
tara:strand:+ start:312 stop:587 length:276 start_codon:yes stop_codon:yes gene_type:complete